MTDARGIVILLAALVLAILAVCAPSHYREQLEPMVDGVTIPPLGRRLLNDSIVHIVLAAFDKALAAVPNNSAKPLCTSLRTSARGNLDALLKDKLAGFAQAHIDGVNKAANALFADVEAHIRLTHCDASAVNSPTAAIRDVAALKGEFKQLVAEFATGVAA